MVILDLLYCYEDEKELDVKHTQQQGHFNKYTLSKHCMNECIVLENVDVFEIAFEMCVEALINLIQKQSFA